MHWIRINNERKLTTTYSMVIRLINKVVGGFGFALSKKSPPFGYDIFEDKVFLDIYKQCKPHTMTSPERMYSLYKAVEHTLDNDIKGDFVECGVWKGGSAMLIALTLLRKGMSDRSIYMYDTFEGMSEPTAVDVSHSGQSAKKLLHQKDRTKKSSIWCYSSIDAVRSNLLSTGYPLNRLFFVKGKVEETLLSTTPSSISLLRLDTDWYESTKIEMDILYPLLQTRGVLIIDDFGYWEGARRAVVEYFYKKDKKPFLHRIDDTGRLIVKE